MSRVGDRLRRAADLVEQLAAAATAEPLVMWLRSEAIQFETSERRGSPYGYPSWHFASQMLGESPADGGFETLSPREES